MHSVGMRLSEYLLTNNIRPLTFARLLGVSHTTVGRWASGEVPPSLAWMEEIARVTNGDVMPNDFMTGRSADAA
jgi:transcriptional regulator with XRE-family HTH domain